MVRAQIDSKNPLAKRVFRSITPIQNYFSMWRGWQMFAPNPLRMNSRIFAKIQTDKMLLEYEFPNPKSDNRLLAYLIGERWRKYLIEGVRLDKNQFLWEDCARWVYRKYKQSHPKTKVLRVDLYRKWANIPPWDQYFIPHRQDSKIHYKEFKFYGLKIARKNELE